MSWKKRLLNVGILSAVFVAAVLFFGYLTNKGNDDMTADMGAATYPQVSFSYDGYSLNTLSGYAKRMDIVSMRDSITPVVNGRLNLSIQAYGNKIESLRYRIFWLNGKEKLLDETVKKPGEEIALEFDQEGLLTEERVLELTLDLGKDQLVHFYTRIKNGTDAHMLECLDYIRNFHESALGKVEGAGVGAAIEPSEEGDNTTFGHVTIHSDYDHVSWGELEPVVEQGERWYIKEMNSSSTSVQLEYRVRCKGEENETDLYTVKEFFRVRHIPEVNKTYLLDYDRTMDQLFDPTKVVESYLEFSRKTFLMKSIKTVLLYRLLWERNCGTIIKIQMKFPWYLVFQLQRIQTGAIWLRSISWNFLKWMERGIRHLLCTVI